eukprot:528729-Pelagomonas_calceolata.AAC.1
MLPCAHGVICFCCCSSCCQQHLPTPSSLMCVPVLVASSVKSANAAQAEESRGTVRKTQKRT